ncbi:hypothetical protein ACGFNY_04910 [Streptomyces chartreusis]|uniref:hypothetical protein n=1 Tax=Streptomyces chartreusis TaxID=1969 RepID=UPI00371BF64D
MTENPQSPRRPGAWPTPRTFLPAPSAEDEYAGLRNTAEAERARRDVTLGAIRSHLECPHCRPAPGMDHDQLRSIRAHLGEQPTREAVRAAAQHWKNAITNIADDIIRGLK